MQKTLPSLEKTRTLNCDKEDLWKTNEETFKIKPFPGEQFVEDEGRIEWLKDSSEVESRTASNQSDPGVSGVSREANRPDRSMLFLQKLDTSSKPDPDFSSELKLEKERAATRLESFAQKPRPRSKSL